MIRLSEKLYIVVVIVVPSSHPQFIIYDCKYLCCYGLLFAQNEAFEDAFQALTFSLFADILYTKQLIKKLHSS